MRIRYLGTHDPHATIMHGVKAGRPVPVLDCVVLEAAPRLTRLTCGNVKLPWTYFLVAYKTLPASFTFYGFYYYSMRVLMSNTRLESLNQPLSCSPYDPSRGYTCLPHSWDGSSFATREELWKTVVGAWYSVQQKEVGSSGQAKLSDTVSLAHPLIDEAL